MSTPGNNSTVNGNVIGDSKRFFEENKSSLIYAHQNEYARFHPDNRRFGFTTGMDTCAALFLWNSDTKESYCLHCHYLTNKNGLQELLEILTEHGNWQITTAAGKNPKGTYVWLEALTHTIADSNPALTINPTLHYNSNENNSYLMDSENGQISPIKESEIEDFMEKPEWKPVFGNFQGRYILEGLQYMTDIGTVPILCFDGVNHLETNHTLPEQEQSRLQLAERLYIQSLAEGIESGEISIPPSPTNLKNTPNQNRGAVRARMIDKLAEQPEHIFNTGLTKQIDRIHETYAGAIWRSLDYNFSKYLELAVDRIQNCNIATKVFGTEAINSVATVTI